MDNMKETTKVKPALPFTSTHVHLKAAYQGLQRMHEDALRARREGVIPCINVVDDRACLVRRATQGYLDNGLCPTCQLLEDLEAGLAEMLNTVTVADLVESARAPSGDAKK